jgi:hypothetical protein
MGRPGILLKIRLCGNYPQVGQWDPVEAGTLAGNPSNAAAVNNRRLSRSGSLIEGKWCAKQTPCDYHQDDRNEQERECDKQTFRWVLAG